MNKKTKTKNKPETIARLWKSYTSFPKRIITWTLSSFVFVITPFLPIIFFFSVYRLSVWHPGFTAEQISTAADTIWGAAAGAFSFAVSALIVVITRDQSFFGKRYLSLLKRSEISSAFEWESILIVGTLFFGVSLFSLIAGSYDNVFGASLALLFSSLCISGALIIHLTETRETYFLSYLYRNHFLVTHHFYRRWDYSFAKMAMKEKGASGIFSYYAVLRSHSTQNAAVYYLIQNRADMSLCGSEFSLFKALLKSLKGCFDTDYEAPMFIGFMQNFFQLIDLLLEKKMDDMADDLLVLMDQDVKAVLESKPFKKALRFSEEEALDELVSTSSVKTAKRAACLLFEKEASMNVVNTLVVSWKQEIEKRNFQSRGVLLKNSDCYASTVAKNGSDPKQTNLLVEQLKSFGIDYSKKRALINTLIPELIAEGKKVRKEFSDEEN